MQFIPLSRSLILNQQIVHDLECKDVDRDFILRLADRTQAMTPATTSSSIHHLRDVVRRLGTQHRDRIYLRCLEGSVRACVCVRT